MKTSAGGRFVVVAFAVLAVLVAVYRRLFGVDFSDEAFYAGIPYWFSAGGRPFVDELHAAQPFGILISPFIQLYVFVSGGLSGIVLYLRLLHLALMLGVAFAIFQALRKAVALHYAAAGALLVGMFVPFNIPSVSYNTLTIGFFTLGVFSGFATVYDETHRRPWAFFTGLGYALAAFCYPTVAGAALAGLVGVLFLSTNRTETAKWLLLGVTAPTLLLLWHMAGQPWKTFQDVLDYAVATSVTTNAKLKIATALKVILKGYPVVWAALLLVVIFLSRKKAPLFTAALLPLFWLVPFLEATLPGLYRSLGYTWVLGSLAPGIYLLSPKTRATRLLVGYVWVVALIAGLTTMFSSANGYVNLAIGFFPACIASLVIVAVWFDSLLKHAPAWIQSGSSAAFLIPAAFLLAFQFGAVYRDDPIPALNYRIPGGPYAGLFTTREKATYIARMQGDLDAIGGNSIAFFDAFPAGYLMASQKPQANTLWITRWIEQPDRPNRAMHVGYWRERGHPDHIVQVHNIPIDRNSDFELKYHIRDPIIAFLVEGYEPVVRRAAYTIWRKKS